MARPGSRAAHPRQYCTLTGPLGSRAAPVRAHLWACPLSPWCTHAPKHANNVTL